MKRPIIKFAVYLAVPAFLLISYIAIPSSKNITVSVTNNTQVTKKSENPITDNEYHIGAFDDGWYSQYEYIKDLLHFNVWHNYAETGKGWYNDVSDNYLEPIPPYIKNIVSTNKSKSMRTYMDRPVMQYVVGGQRVDYQCEQIPSDAPYWYYAFSSSRIIQEHITDITDNDPKYGSGEKVKYCKAGNWFPSNSNVLIDSGVISDRELSFNYTNLWMTDYYWDWYLMPKIRIDPAYASATQHNNDTVCRIQITGWDGQTVKDVFLKVRNFKQTDNSVYNGDYLESYFFEPGQQNLKIDTSLWRNFINTKDKDFFAFDWTKYSGNDFKIYWYGKCDMWIDRLRLENEPAHQYLTLKNPKWIERVNDEIDFAVANQKEGVPNYFYYEEAEFSHFQSIKELNRQIMERSQNKTALIIWLNYDLFRVHIPGFPFGEKSMLNASQLKKYLSEDFGLNTIVMGSYGLEGYSQWDVDHNSYWTKSFHPNTLQTASDYEPKNGILSFSASPTVYDDWLQVHLDTGRGGSKLNYINKLMDGLSENSNMRIIDCPQAHLWFSSGHKLKEPTNEELELQTCLGITYNAKGTMFFSYTTFGNFNSPVYGYGIIDATVPDKCYPRHKSVYGQDKFNKIGEISAKLEKWGPYIVKFKPELTTNCIYRLAEERNSFLNSTYFADVITYRQGTAPPDLCSGDNPGGNLPDGLTYECKDKRYLQMAVFKTSADDVNKYFMVVNRRCSPYIDNSTEDKRGGMRNVRIRFDLNAAEFGGHTLWKIIDLETNSVVLTFSKSESKILDLGLYLPGQGKLYKIAPAD
ncbi:MAG: hypothetical protein WCK13_05850 [Ignavibacteriota bacterium]